MKKKKKKESFILNGLTNKKRNMKTKSYLMFSLLLLSALLAGCNSDEEPSPVELHLDKNEARIHACFSQDCKRKAVYSDVIRIFDGEGDYRIESQSEVLWYSSPYIEMYPSEYKVADVLKLTIEGDEIKIEYIDTSIPVWKAKFTIYDKNGNYADFTVTDPFIVTWI